MICLSIVRTPKGSCNNAPFSEGFLEGFSRLTSRRFQEGFLEGLLQWVVTETRVLRRVLRRGSKKGLSRRILEGRSTPFREYDPVGVRPIQSSKLLAKTLSFAKPVLKAPKLAKGTSGVVVEEGVFPSTARLFEPSLPDLGLFALGLTQWTPFFLPHVHLGS